ncbi:MAG TPA: SDR family NAD(P)-dependent oxidoreductase [Gemmatimonadales bacterium]|nr:SDR family NAD(P)-dependent oxidoreductase [Gemmatimonadales bacterium]
MIGRAKAVVVVTGATRGIGRACLRELVRAGFQAIAGVRDIEAGHALQEELGPSVTPVPLDVTRPEQIAAAADVVREATGEAGLAGLVNNAGIVVAGPMEFLPLDALREQFEVNLVGLVGLTQALLPALRRARGRIVNVSSVNGRLATPFTGAYAASKFALEAVSDALRRELNGAVDVIVIQPGSFRTDVWTTSRERAMRIAAGYPPACRQHYGRVLEAMAGMGVPARAGDPAAVGRVVVRALTARRPRARYAVGLDSRLGLLLAALMPTRWLDALLGARRRRSRAASA